MENSSQISYWASEIVKGLWLGGSKSGQDIDVLKNSGIKHIIVVGSELSTRFPNTFNYLHIKAEDEEDFPIWKYFKQCSEFIYNGLKQKDQVLVHCEKGISRSVSIVIAYTMICKKLSFEKALKYVQSKHKCANPNSGFIKQLENLGMYLEYVNNVQNQSFPL
jgi:protein-tyrosine phosphatase